MSEKASPIEPTQLKPRRGLLLYSAGVRFAIIYALVFGLSAFLLAVALWYSALGLMQNQAQDAIRNDAQTLLEHYEIGGVDALSAAIVSRLNSTLDPDGIYLLADQAGGLVAGNLDQWPANLDQVDIWYELPVRQHGVKSVALLRMEVLPGGMRLLVGRDMRARLELRNVLRVGLVWALCLMVVLGLFGALLIRSLFQRTIRDVSITAAAIAHGDISRRVPVSGLGDEFDDLALTINDMLDRISRLMDGVRQVSNAIAHDLRTPVTRARARLEDAALHAHSKDEMEAAIDRAIQDLDDIMAVFQALMRISEIEAGARRAAFAPFDLATMLLDIDELYNAVAEEKGITLNTVVKPPLQMLGDRELIQQAVVNLLDNAIKFSAAGTTVDLVAQRVNGMMLIAVADHGPGIAEKDRSRATERFFRAETARNTSGYGLGLALVAAIVQLHNGSISLEDNQPGLRVLLALPVGVQKLPLSPRV